jgi:hypothetical protein
MSFTKEKRPGDAPARAATIAHGALVRWPSADDFSDVD